jgi:hypothetical protein
MQAWVQVAHQKLLASAIRFRNETAVPPALLAPLATLHSYILVKATMQLGNVSTAAQLLKRVAGNLSSFDAAHTAQILASAALQCSSAGYSASAFELAGELMHAQHREALKGMTAYKRRIESLVCHPKPLQSYRCMLRVVPEQRCIEPNTT